MQIKIITALPFIRDQLTNFLSISWPRVNFVFKWSAPDNMQVKRMLAKVFGILLCDCVMGEVQLNQKLLRSSIHRFNVSLGLVVIPNIKKLYSNNETKKS